jgi:DNA ligase-1
VAREVLPGHLPEASTLTLAAVEAAVEELATTSGTKAKTALLIALLHRATALEATYLVKLVSGDLRIGLKQGLVEDALARGFGRPLAAVSHTVMLLGDLGEVAVLARADALASAALRLFHPLGAMLATPADSPEAALANLPEGYALVEDKFDGVRAQVHREGDRLAIYSRTLDDVTHRFPELHAPLMALPGPFVLDGEIIGARAGRVLPFNQFQQRLGRKAVTDDLLRAIPAALIAFDLLYRDGALLFSRPLTERRALLAALLNQDDISHGDDDGEHHGAEAVRQRGAIRLSAATRVTEPAQIDALFTAARERGNEGLMVKLPHSAYTPGRRGAEWRKVKRALAALDVVVTAVEWGHGKRRHLLSDYTFAVRASETDPTLLNVGKAYSGLTDRELAELTQWFQAHTRQDFGRGRTVDPEIVLEVTFDAVQESARHRSGYALRFPRILRVRDDKPASEIDTLAAVRAIAER